MKVYIAVTRDKYEFPIAMADSVVELAKMTKANPKTIYSAISHIRSGRRKTSIYQEVEIGEIE